MNSRTKKITTIGMMCAMAMVMNLLLHFPIIPAVSFLNYDPKDIVIVIASFIYGPFSAFVMSAICAVLDVMLRGGTILDVLMNMIATCMFSCVAGAIYKKEHTKKGAPIVRSENKSSEFFLNFYLFQAFLKAALLRSLESSSLLRIRRDSGVTSRSSSWSMKSMACSRLRTLGGVNFSASSAEEERVLVRYLQPTGQRDIRAVELAAGNGPGSSDHLLHRGQQLHHHHGTDAGPAP